ncbi:MAG: hypothetical protein AB8G05_18620 [Oligoflexales bacterium]
MKIVLLIIGLAFANTGFGKEYDAIVVQEIDSEEIVSNFDELSSELENENQTKIGFSKNPLKWCVANPLKCGASVAATIMVVGGVTYFGFKDPTSTSIDDDDSISSSASKSHESVVSSSDSIIGSVITIKSSSSDKSVASSSDNAETPETTIDSDLNAPKKAIKNAEALSSLLNDIDSIFGRITN